MFVLFNLTDPEMLTGVAVAMITFCTVTGVTLILHRLGGRSFASGSQLFVSEGGSFVSANGRHGL